VKSVNLIFPHQLFRESQLLENGYETYLIEEYLFFKQYRFHKQKIAFHRASMKAYEQHLQQLGIRVKYIASDHQLADIRQFDKEIKRLTITQVHVIDPVDDWLEQRLEKSTQDIELITYLNPQFLNSKDDLSKFFRSDKKSFFQTSFYKQQRKSHGILLDEQGQPEGGKWTFDIENRKKYPKDKTPPAIQFPGQSSYWSEAVDYVGDTFSDNPGEISKDRLYPITHKEASDWLDQFLTHRFQDFGIYEDAIVREASILNHSVLSPLINAGLLLPEEVVKRSLSFAKKQQIPINSIEGFIRQIIGWREFIRGMYVCKGGYSRTRNFWNFSRKIPDAFYDGTTGIEPVDLTIRKVLQTGYCHHIERLMVLGNFMLLCEFDPDEVYRWFMELFIDAYDWVMVPNVYGMSQFADGGTFATKPYISGANYLRKMSDYPKGDWEDIWNGLFWRFMSKHQEFFIKNPRSSMLVHSFNKMPEEKRRSHMDHAQAFLQKLDA
jgi:deoxyribodipyrimidine photolyase-related protein